MLLLKKFDEIEAKILDIFFLVKEFGSVSGCEERNIGRP